MRIDLNDATADLDGLPRFQRAAFHARRLHSLATETGAMALCALCTALLVPHSLWRSLLLNVGAALLLVAAGLQSGYWIARWRCSALRAPDPEPVVEPSVPLVDTDAANSGDNSNGSQTWLLSPLGKAVNTLYQQLGVASVWLSGLAVLALLAVPQAWDLGLTGDAPGKAGNFGAGAMLVVAFCLLVMERYLAGAAAAEWPEAQPMAQLVRMAIVTLLLSVICVFFNAEGRNWPARLVVLAGLLPAAVAVELLLRAVLAMFLPQNTRLEPALLADSFIAGLLRWPLHPFAALQDELQKRYGIDLRQNWAFGFVRRALIPVVVLVALVGWLLSGSAEIPLDSRGVYERFGKPVAVVGPGLRAGLPWPLARWRRIENGAVHELATSLSVETTAVQSGDEEGPAPASANRLWDVTHAAEQTQVIAGAAGDQQSFQIVNMDVRFIYRIGLTNEAALAATYNSVDVPSLIRSTGSRVLVHDFAARTLDGLLGEQRRVVARDVGNAVQAELDKLSTGVEILATLIEAIHPPVGAADAYHSVQAAQIEAQATLARERGDATQRMNEAQLAAATSHDSAMADAREATAAAQVTDLRFAAERNAYRVAGAAFLQEHYLSQLSEGLAKTKLVILDHRIASGSAPTIDLRTYAAPAYDSAPITTDH